MGKLLKINLMLNKTLLLLNKTNVRKIIFNLSYFFFQIEFDWKGFEEQCKGIVHDTNEKFIDLGQDDGPQSAYGDGLM